MTDYKHINELGKLNSKSDKELIVQAFKNINSFYRNQYILPEESYIFRSRLGPSKLEPSFFSELSYIPNEEWVGIGRANPPKVPVFYGVTDPDFSKSNQTKAIMVAIMECSELLRSDNENNGVELGCVSRWRLTRALKVFSFFNYDFGESTDKMIIDFNIKLNEQLELNSDNPERDLEINRWIATIFAEDFKSSDKHKYQVSSMLANNFMDSEHDGIIYPTVQGKGTGINIALKKEAADTLRLEYVCQIANLKFKNHTRTFFTRQSSDIVNGKILNWNNCE